MPPTRKSRLQSGATAVARRLAATMPVSPKSARQTASRARCPSAPVEAVVPQTKDDVELVEHGADGDGRGHRHRVLEDLVAAPATRGRRRRRGPRGCAGCRGTAGPAARTPPSRPSPWPRSASGCGAGRRRGRTRAARGRRGRSARRRRSRRPRGRAAARRRASPAAPSAGAPAPRATRRPHHVAREDAERVAAAGGGRARRAITPRRSVRIVKDSSCARPGRQRADAVAVRRRRRPGTSSVVGSSRPAGDVARRTTPAATDSPATTRSGSSAQVDVDRGAAQQERQRRARAAAGRRPPAPPSPASRASGATYAAPAPMPRTSQPDGADDRQQLLARAPSHGSGHPVGGRRDGVEQPPDDGLRR